MFNKKSKYFINNSKVPKEVQEKVQEILKANKTILLDLGCGSAARKNHIGIDIIKNPDICWDLTKGIPFPDNSIAEIRSDHFFEHLYLNEVVFILKECHRVLKKEGVLDFTVPHINPYIEPYLKDDYSFFEKTIYDVPNELYATSFDRISWLLHRNGEHRSMFDRESIFHKVKLAGFDNINFRTFDKNRDINYRFSSIYVIAKK